MKTKGEAIKFKLEFMVMMLSTGRHDHADKALSEALEICDSITEVMPEEAE
jgi:hypothetical protein